MAVTLALPEQLAPALIYRIEALLAEVPLAADRRASAPNRVAPGRPTAAPRCVACHRDGKLGGHHEPDGTVVWIHRSCHRRLHQRHQLPRGAYARIRQYTQTAC